MRIAVKTFLHLILSQKRVKETSALNNKNDHKLKFIGIQLAKIECFI